MDNEITAGSDGGAFLDLDDAANAQKIIAALPDGAIPSSKVNGGATAAGSASNGLSVNGTSGDVVLGGALSAATVIDSDSFSLNIEGQGQKRIAEVDPANAASSSEHVVTSSTVRSSAKNGAGDMAEIVIRRGGNFSIEGSKATGEAYTIAASELAFNVGYSDNGSGQVSEWMLTPDGNHVFRSPNGSFRFDDGTGTGTVAPIPIISNMGDQVLRVDGGNGNVTRSNINAFRTLGGNAAPVDGVTVAYSRHQIYIERNGATNGSGTMWYANVASTDPDNSGAGSEWVSL